MGICGFSKPTSIIGRGFVRGKGRQSQKYADFQGYANGVAQSVTILYVDQANPDEQSSTICLL